MPPSSVQKIMYYQVDESGVLVQPRPDDARVDGHRLHVAVTEPPLEGPREHDLRRLRVAVSALGTVELPEMAQTLRFIHFALVGKFLPRQRPKLMRLNAWKKLKGGRTDYLPVILRLKKQFLTSTSRGETVKMYENYSRSRLYGPRFFLYIY